MNTRDIFVKDPAFYKKLLAIAVPVIIQNLLTEGGSILTVFMMGRLGEVEISALSLAGMVQFTLMVVNAGMAGGANVLLAQYHGSGDTGSIRDTMGVVEKVCFAAGLLVGLFVFCFPRFVMGIYTPDPAVIEAGARYLRIVALSYPLFMVINGCIIMLRSVGQVRISLYIFMVSLCMQTLLNWVFVFGNLGAPAMGVYGAAIALLITRVVEMALLIYLVFFKENVVALRPGDIFKRHSRRIGSTYARVATPIILNEVLWSIGSSTIAMVMARQGTEATAAYGIQQAVSNLVMVVMIGASSATGVLVGNTIGEGDRQGAQRQTVTLLVLSLVMGAVLGAGTFLTRGPVLSMYKITSLTHEYAMGIMAVGAALLIFQSATMIVLIGALRAGGDGKFVLFLDIFFMWGLALPLGALAGFYFNLPVPVVFLCLKLDEFIKSILGILRMLRGRWIKDVTGGTAEAQSPGGL